MYNGGSSTLTPPPSVCRTYSISVSWSALVSRWSGLVADSAPRVCVSVGEGTAACVVGKVCPVSSGEVLDGPGRGADLLGIGEAAERDGSVVTEDEVCTPNICFVCLSSSRTGLGPLTVVVVPPSSQGGNGVGVGVAVPEP